MLFHLVEIPIKTGLIENYSINFCRSNMNETDNGIRDNDNDDNKAANILSFLQFN